MCIFSRFFANASNFNYRYNFLIVPNYEFKLNTGEVTLLF